jgi:hypothetical protein
MQDDFSKRRPSVAPDGLTAHSASFQPVIGYHVMLRLGDEGLIATTTQDRLAAAGIMIRQGRSRRLLACAVVDGRAHAILLCSRAGAGEYAGRTATAMRTLLKLDLAFDRARIKPIHDVRQLESLFQLVIGQDEHEGTNLLDLAGLRVDGSYSRALLREHLPAIADRLLLERFQVDMTQPLPFDPSLLMEATMAATGRSSLTGRKRVSVRARSAAAAVARPHTSAPELAKLFQVDVRTAFRMRAAPCDEVLASAIEAQLRLLAMRAR